MTRDELAENLYNANYMSYCKSERRISTISGIWNRANSKTITRYRKLAEHVLALIEKEKIKARLDEIKINMTVDSQRLNELRIKELERLLEAENEEDSNE